MFENLLQLAADEDRLTLKAMAVKYPSLQKQFDLGEKFEGVQGRLRALAPEYGDNPDLPVAELEKWHKWKANDWPTWDADNKRQAQALTEALATVEDLQNNRSAEVTPDEIKQIVAATLKEAGFVSNTELEGKMTTLINEKVGPSLEAKVNGLTTRFEDVFDKIEDVRDRHAKELGETIRPKEIFAFMKENKIADPEEAYQKMTAGKYAEKSAAQLAAEKKSEYERGKKEAEVEFRKATAGARSMPVDGQGSSGPPKGALMRRALSRQTKDAEGNVDIDKIPLGKGIGRAAAMERATKQAEAVN